MKSIIQKKIISARPKFQDKKFPQCLSMPLSFSLKAVDHVKSEVRSGHNVFKDCRCSFLDELSSCRLTYENCN